MLYKTDWSQAQERLEAWWDGDFIDRPPVQVFAPREGVDLTEWEREREFLTKNAFGLSFPECKKAITRFEKLCRETFFGGEAFPSLSISFCPGVMTLYLGGVPQYLSESKRGTTQVSATQTENVYTVWVETPTEWGVLENLEFDPENRWWQLTKKVTQTAMENGKGKFVTSMADLGGITTTLACLRGSENFVVDLFKNPDKVRKVSGWILERWFECFDELSSILEYSKYGMSFTYDLWSPGSWCLLEADYLYYMNTKQVEQFVLPCIREQSARLDNSIYHLDGEYRHLDPFLEIDELNGIQWVPGYGHPAPGDAVWLPMYRKIRDRGKLLVIDDVPSPDLRMHLDPKGILVRATCESQSEAERLLQTMQKWH